MLWRYAKKILKIKNIHNALKTNIKIWNKLFIRMLSDCMTFVNKSKIISFSFNTVKWVIFTIIKIGNKKNYSNLIKLGKLFFKYSVEYKLYIKNILSIEILNHKIFYLQKITKIK